MAERKGKRRVVLDGYAEFLKERELALPRYRSHLVRWVCEFPLFAQNRRGFTFEQTRSLFLDVLKKLGGIQPWQMRQVADALRIYRYQNRCGG